MCTVSWLVEDNGYALFFNRDELKTRSRALPPRIQNINDVSVIAPQDPQGGGSWIATNEYGITVCLLNHYGAYARVKAGKKYKSRGQLVMRLCYLEKAKEIATAIQAISMDDFPPFRLFWVTPGGALNSCVWNGEICSWEKPDQIISPISGSSFENNQVIFERAEAYNRIVGPGISSDSLRRFHESYDPSQGAFSVNMHREDAQTMSMSVVTVSREQIKFEYRDKPGTGFEFGANQACMTARV